MNNTQLYLSIGIPSFLVILAWLSNRTDIQKMGDRIDKGLADLRVAMHKELDGLRAEMRKELDALRAELHRGLNGIRGEMIAFRREMDADMVPFHERLAVVEARTEKM